MFVNNSRFGIELIAFFLFTHFPNSVQNMEKIPLAMERSQNQTQLENNNNNNNVNNNSQRKSLNSTRLKSKKYGVNFIRYILQTFNVMFFVSISYNEILFFRLPFSFGIVIFYLRISKVLLHLTKYFVLKATHFTHHQRKTTPSDLPSS